MRAKAGVTRAPKVLVCGALLLGGTLASATVAVAADRSGAWIESPYRNFGAPVALLGGRVLLSDEANDPVLRSALATDLARLSATLHDRQGWRIPTADGDPLRIFIARREADGVRRVAVRAITDQHLVGPALELDASGMSAREIEREVARLYSFATLAAYGAPDQTFLTAAASEFLAGNGDSAEERERTRIAAAAPNVELSLLPVSVGRLYVEEFARLAGGPAALRSVFEKAAESRDGVLAVLGRSYAESTSEGEDSLLLRTAARLYATYETEPGPSKIGIPDLELSGIDAATPAMHAFRHRSTVLAGDSDGALRVQWPDQGAPAAAVVRYRDAALPPDVLFFAPGRSKAVPLSGVARIDWIVSGSTTGAPLGGAVATVDEISAFPFAGLSAQAVAGPGGPRIGWTTSAHESLVGWAVFREEVLPDGRIARTGPQILPSSNQASESFRYAYVDPDASAGTYYRYTIWAVTEDGLLARAFSATLRTPD
jgi:hypothetical protein